jgi:hypothetical protein
MAMLFSLAVMITLMAAGSFAANNHVSQPFMGPKANKGHVTHAKVNGRHMLTLSDDFVVPDTPDPHWQIVDSKGNVYLLEKLKIKSDRGDMVKKSLVLPAYVRDVAKVQIWCAWAETLLGEAPFETVQK